MSLETKTRIICDGCGAFVEGKVANTLTSIGESYWDARNKAKTAGWLTIERSYRRDAHYCRDCADKPQKPTDEYGLDPMQNLWLATQDLEIL